MLAVPELLVGLFENEDAAVDWVLDQLDQALHNCLNTLLVLRVALHLVLEVRDEILRPHAAAAQPHLLKDLILSQLVVLGLRGRSAFGCLISVRAAVGARALCARLGRFTLGIVVIALPVSRGAARRRFERVDVALEIVVGVVVVVGVSRTLLLFLVVRVQLEVIATPKFFRIDGADALVAVVVREPLLEIKPVVARTVDQLARVAVVACLTEAVAA